MLHPRRVLEDLCIDNLKFKAIIRFYGDDSLKILNEVELKQILYVKSRIPFKNVQFIQKYIPNSQDKKDYVILDYIAPMDNLMEDCTIIYGSEVNPSLNRMENFKSNCIEICNQICKFIQKAHKIVNVIRK